MARKLRARRKDGAPPRCPRHKRSDVRFAGTYGKKGHKRQRYKCWPKGGGKPHTFTEPLPRQNTVSGDCWECERYYQAHEGPPTPRLYDFSAREIAAALVLVGDGSSYRSAAARVRKRAKREPVGGHNYDERLYHGQLVADWVEVFAPVLFEHYRATIDRRYKMVRDGHGTLIVDSVPFHSRGLLKKQYGERLWCAYSALAYTSAGAQLVRVKTYLGTGGSVAAEWADFLQSLPGETPPQRIVSDMEPSILKAVAQVFPDAELYICEWHLRQRVQRILEDNGAWGAKDLDEEAKLIGLARVQRAVKQAFSSEIGWREFVELAAKLNIKQLNRFIKKNGARIDHQLEVRPLNHKIERHGLAVATGPLEQKQRVLRAQLAWRAPMLRNRPRTDRLLMLLQLAIDGLADERQYTEVIKRWLEQNQGRPMVERRLVTDEGGTASLRAYSNLS